MQKLAAEIDRFSSDFDPYEYKDTVDNWELQVDDHYPMTYAELTDVAKQE